MLLYGTMHMPTLPTKSPQDFALQKVTSVADLGSFVRSVRKSRKITQQELADISGVGRRFMRELEHGKPTLEIGRVLMVTAALGIDLSGRTR